jgi:hypothetical protein
MRGVYERVYARSVCEECGYSNLGNVKVVEGIPNVGTIKTCILVVGFQV